MDQSPLFNFEDIAEPPVPRQPPSQQVPLDRNLRPIVRQNSVKEEEIQELKEKNRKKALLLMSKFMGKRSPSPNLSAASRKIQKVVEESTPKNHAELQVKKKKVKELIESALKRLEDVPECKLVFYGSTENGFWQGKSSDIDCSIVTVNPDDLFKLKDVKYILNHLKRCFPQIVKADVINASNLSFLKCSMPFKFDQEEKPLQFDINVGSVLGNYNSELLKTYVKLEPLFLKAGHFLKHWSKTEVRKQHKFDQTQTLSSYALLMMLLVFLQSRFELLPRLQQIPDKNKDRTIKVLDQRNKRVRDVRQQYFMAKIYFNTNQAIIQHYIFCDEELTTARILIEFFFFYAFVFDPDTMIINVPQGAFTPKQPHAIKRKEYRDIPFSIIDPFDQFHNPGKTIKAKTIQYKVTMEEMMKAFFELIDNP